MPAAPVLCIGAAHWDVIARARTRLAPGADLPGVIAARPGGVALNVALALARLGRSAALLAAVGRDAEGDRLLAAAAQAGVDCTHVLRQDGATDRYVAIEDGSGALFAAVADCAALERAGTRLLDPLRGGRLAARQVVLDGNLPDAVLREALRLAPEAEVALVPASPGKAARLAALLARPRVTLYLNRAEAEAICGAGFAGSRDAAAALVARGAAAAVVTDGAASATHATRDGAVSLPPPAVAPRSVTGAGDAFVAAHLGARADGLAEGDALAAALAAAARHITREAPCPLP